MGQFDDLAIFAKIAEAGGLSAAARELGLPKQTLSRRLRKLEEALGAQLVVRTTRRFRLTDLGREVAHRSQEIVRIGEETTRLSTRESPSPSGLLRIASDDLLAERFLAPVVAEFLSSYPETRVELVTTRRFVDLVSEQFDLAFWIGHPGGRSLRAIDLGPALVRYCASPRYLDAHGRPARPRDVTRMDCLLLTMEEVGPHWPFRGRRGVRWLRVSGRLTTNNYEVLYRAALAGLGIALLPAFAVRDDLREGRLESVLDEFIPPLGSVELVAPRARRPSAPARAFESLVRARFGTRAPWLARSG